MGQIPSPIWGQKVGQQTPFMEEAGLTTPTHTQEMLCVYCVKQDNFLPPEFIIMVNGNSVCREHVINLVD